MAGPKVESRSATDIAVIEHKGPYDSIPWDEYIPRLYGWAKEQKVMPGFRPIAIYHDDPGTRAPDELRAEIAITYKGRAKASKGTVLKKLPAMRVATISHKGPKSEFRNTYAKLFKWIDEKGLEVSGPPMEIHSKKPEVVDGVTTFYAKIMVPVRKR